MTLELIVKTPDSAFLREVEFNFETLKKELTNYVANKYGNLVYSTDNINEAKNDRAELNKIKKMIEDERKRVKKLCLQAYQPFEDKIKILVSEIDSVNFNIDAQVKSYEEGNKREKENKIERFFNSNVGHLENILKLEKIFNPKWLNATYNLKNIEAEITETINKVTKDLETIDLWKSPFALEVQDTYLRTLDIGEALREDARLKEQQKRMLDYKQQQQEQTNPPVEVTQPPIKNNPTTNQKVYTLSFRVKDVTKEQLDAIKACFIENNINYEKI